MPLRLKLFYIITIIIFFHIGVFGYDSLLPKEQQLFWLMTGKSLNLHAGISVLIMLGGAMLTTVTLFGMITDAINFRKNKK